MNNRMQVVVALAIVLFIVLPIALLFTPWWIAGVGMLAFGVAILMAVTVIFVATQLGLPVHWYVAYWMAKRDFVFTTVPEAHFKVVTRFGATKKVIMSKEGYKIDKNGNIEPRLSGDSPESLFPGGLRMIGLPWIDRVYSAKMSFVKSLSDGNVKEYNGENTTDFLAGVDYPYALPFVNCEDKAGLPILGHATLLARVDNPLRSLFATSNFYNAMTGLVLPVLRACFENDFSFIELKDKKKADVKRDLDKLLWVRLNEDRPGEAKSVIDDLLEKYGVRIIGFRIVNIDPPEKYRDISLSKWTAEMEAEAANAIAKAQAIRVGDPIRLAMDEWVKGQVIDSETEVQAKARLIKSGDYAKYALIVYNLILAEGGKLQVSQTLLGSPDGSSLPSSLQYLSVGGGGGAGVLLGGKGNKGGSGKNP